MTTNAATVAPRLEGNSRHSTLTRTLLACGFVAAPFYIVTSLTQAFTREGFDLARHQWSLLTNGDLGWIQVANFVITGVLFAAFAIGMRRALQSGTASRWAPRLIAVFGASLAAAGIFQADPALGFPVGTPDGPPVEVTTAGVIHFAAAGCLVLARRQVRDGARRLAVASRVTGIGFLAGFLCVASGAGSVVANLLFLASVILVFTWLGALAVHHYRATDPQKPTARAADPTTSTRSPKRQENSPCDTSSF